MKNLIAYILLSRIAMFLLIFVTGMALFAILDPGSWSRQYLPQGILLYTSLYLFSLWFVRGITPEAIEEIQKEMKNRD